MRSLGAAWLVFGGIVQGFHDSIVCARTLACVDDYTLSERMEWAFTVVWVLVVAGLFIGRRGAALLSVGLGGLGLAIVTRHTPKLWWITFEVVGFSALILAGIILDRMWERARARGTPPSYGIRAPSRHRRPTASLDPVLSGYRQNRLLIAAVLILPMIAVGAMAIPRARDAAAFEKTAPTTEGTITDILDGGFVVEVEYRHPTHGLQRVSLETYLDYEIGDIVFVLYDRSDARHIALEGETYDGLGVAFLPTIIVLIGAWIATGAFFWTRRIARIASTSTHTYVMRSRRWTRSGLRGGTWLTLFSSDPADTVPIASYRLMRGPAPDPRQAPDVLVRGELSAGGVVVARDPETIYWPRARVRVSERFHRKVWASLVSPPPIPAPPVPPPPALAPPPLPGGAPR